MSVPDVWVVGPTRLDVRIAFSVRLVAQSSAHGHAAGAIPVAGHSARTLEAVLTVSLRHADGVHQSYSLHPQVSQVRV